MPGDVRAVMPGAPDLSRGMVAVDVNAPQFWKLVAVQDDSTGQRSRLGMMMFQRRLRMTF